jgi:hypothetical protein
MKYTLDKAFRDSLKKWEIIAEGGGRWDASVFPESIRRLRNYCGLCQYFGTSVENDNCVGDGKTCPLVLRKRIRCGDMTHPYSNWVFNKTEENARKVYNLIKKKYEIYLDESKRNKSKGGTPAHAGTT